MEQATLIEEKYPFHEFFAGSGLVRVGLSDSFLPVWADDVSPDKAAVYEANFGAGALQQEDICSISGADIPAGMLSWASFPCQDLSLAGKIGGIHSERSGLVWQWLRIIDELGENAPRVVCLENVAGLMSSHDGDDYRALHTALASRGYSTGAILLDAALFLPQSRKRVFVIGTRGPIPEELRAYGPTWATPTALVKVATSIENFVWWNCPFPPPSSKEIADIVEDVPFDRDDVAALIPESHIKKFAHSGRVYATGYRRTRNGCQVLELRCDGKAGCLRTPAGGSSRQFLVRRDETGLHARLLTVRETARLMGAPEDFMLPGSYNEGYKAMGDAVAVPVVQYLSDNLLTQLVEAAYEL